MSRNLLKDNRGFTIIEVLIVLAIAGLIMVMVFIAVPNLQRNQRNSARRNEAARLLAAANNFVSATNGSLPTNSLTHVNQIISDGGPYQQYAAFPAQAAAVTASVALVQDEVFVLTGTSTRQFTTTALTAANAQAAAIVTNARCGATPGQTTTLTRSIAVVYTLEAGSGTTPTLACVSN